jgi:hypothetical protein
LKELGSGCELKYFRSRSKSEEHGSRNMDLYASTLRDPHFEDHFLAS